MEQTSGFVLRDLSIDVLANTTLFLPNKDLQCLYMTGDSLLLYKLRNGGVKTLEIGEEPPTFTAQFTKLKRYTSSRTIMETQENFMAELTSMPTTLIDIEWRRSVPSFGMFAHFQQLQWLSFPTFSPQGAENYPLILPLVSVSISEEIYQQVLQLLPPTLTSLKFSTSSRQTFDWGMDPNLGATLHKYVNLKELAIFGQPPSLVQIPPSITKLSLEYRHGKLDWGSEEFNWTHLPQELLSLNLQSTVLPTLVSNWKLLPSTLRSFETTLTCIFTRELADALPRSLTKFTATSSPISWKFAVQKADEPVMKIPVASRLPEGLVHLGISLNSSIGLMGALNKTEWKEKAEEFPRSLISLELFGGQLADYSRLPPRLTRISSIVMPPHAFELLPPTLTSLWVTLPNQQPQNGDTALPKNFIGPEEFTPLPSRVKSLFIISQLMFSLKDWMSHALESLQIESRAGFGGKIPDDWFADVPPSLTMLKVETLPLLETHHLSHMQHLISLKEFIFEITAQEWTQAPDGSALASLPTTLNKLSIPCASNVSEDDLAALPPNLTHLTLNIPERKNIKLPISVIDKLPKSLRYMLVPVWTEDPDGFRNRLQQTRGCNVLPLFGPGEEHGW
jgi:hypothetical protein